MLSPCQVGLRQWVSEVEDLAKGKYGPSIVTVVVRESEGE